MILEIHGTWVLYSSENFVYKAVHTVWNILENRSDVPPLWITHDRYLHQQEWSTLTYFFMVFKALCKKLEKSCFLHYFICISIPQNFVNFSRVFPSFIRIRCRTFLLFTVQTIYIQFLHSELSVFICPHTYWHVAWPFEGYCTKYQ